MIRVYLNKTPIAISPVINRYYSFNTRDYGTKRANLSLSSDGKYKLTVDGIEYSIHELSAKRSPSYKTAMKEVTNQMILEIGKYNAAFTDFYKLIKGPNSKSQLKSNLAKLKVNQYKRQIFTLSEPRKSDVLDDLKEEANNLFYTIWSNKVSQKRKYVKDHLDEEYAKRLSNWNELKEYHESIQDIFEVEANKRYQTEYDTKRKVYEDKINGPYSYVIEKIKAITTLWKLPFDLVLDCDYDENNGIINCIAKLPSYFGLPFNNALLLTSGKISIKEKSPNELDRDQSSCLFGLAYYLTGLLFNTSANVGKVRVSVTKDDFGYFWVEFERDSFIMIDYGSLNPLADIFNQPIVVNYKTPTITPVNLDDFNKQIDIKIRAIDIQKTKPNLTTMPLKDAELIVKQLNDVVLWKAIKYAKDNKMPFVFVDKAYVSLLKEIKSISETKSKIDVLSNNQSDSKYFSKDNKKTYEHVSNYKTLLREAGCYAIKRYKYSAEMLQNDLSVDNITARKLIMELKKHGVLGSLDQDGLYNVLIDSEKVLDFVFSWTK